VRTGRYAPEVETAVYFFVCEALSNTMKYASARRVVVTLGRSAEALCASVEDDGRGFELGRTALSGLKGLRDRLEALGGEVSVESRPGLGTRVEAMVPVA
jgi:signal transduction histidine kinase